MASLIILTGQINSWNRPLARVTSNINRTGLRLTPESPARTDQIEQARVSEAYGKLPLSLEANLGQTDSRVRFLSRGPGFTLFLTQSEAVFSTQSSTVLRMKLARANRAESIEGVGQMPGKSNYFIGNDRRKWRANVPNYSRVRYKNVYSGIDLIYYGNQQELEYDFIVSPGARPGAISMTFEGMRRMHIDSNGDLLLDTAEGQARHHKPKAYQEVAGRRKEVAASFLINERREVSFALGEYDERLALVIDPVFSYSTFLGGNNADAIQGIAVDSAGNAYVTGNTSSTNFPVTANGYQTVHSGGFNDVIVSKLNATGTALLSSTYLGGSGSEFGIDIAIDSSGNAYVTGSTASSDFPTTPGAFQTNRRGGEDFFIVKIDTNPATCSPQSKQNPFNCVEALVYSTYLGSSADDFVSAIAADASGSAYVVGWSNTFDVADFPTTPGAFQTNGHLGNPDGFVTKLNPTGTGLVYSTYLGGGDTATASGHDRVYGIALDSQGNAYLTGETNSVTFPTTPGSFQPACTNCGSFNPSSEAIVDGFVTKLNPTGTGLVYSTYLGGNHQDFGAAIAVDSSGSAYVTGRVFSSDFPTTQGVLRRTNGGAFRSVNGGVNWNDINTGLISGFGTAVRALVIDPTNPSTIYAALHTFTSTSGVYKSTDSGASWSQTGFDFNVRALAIDPVNPSTLYVAADTSGLFKSTDGGDNWSTIHNGLLSTSIAAVAVDPVNPAILYAGNIDVGVHKSTDGGNSWFYTDGPGSGTLALSFDPSDHSTIYCARNNSVDRSTNAGGSWTYIGTGISMEAGTAVNALSVDPASPATLYAGTSRGVFKTTDGAATPWFSINNGLTSTNVNALVIDPTDSSTVYVGTQIGVFKTIDGGQNWKPANRGLIGTSIISLALDPDNPAVVHAGAAAAGGEIFVTKIDSQGAALDYSTYLGFGLVRSIAVNQSGEAYVFGETPGGFPVTADAFKIFNISLNEDTFVSMISATGAQLLFSTYLGGTASEFAGGIATHASGNVYVAGTTDSSNFPVTPGAFQTMFSGTSQAYITKIGFPVTASYDEYTVDQNDTLSVSAPGVLANDVDVDGSSLTALLVSGPARGALTLNGNGSFTYTPNANFTGFDSFIYRARNLANISSNLAEVAINVTACSYQLSATSQVYPHRGGAGTVAVSAANGCSWAAVSNDTWIVIVSPDGEGEGAVSFEVRENFAISPRVGSITAAGQTVMILQAGTAGGDCRGTISPLNESVSVDGGTGSVDITIAQSCIWSAVSNATWITITSQNSGIGPGTLTYSVAPNTGGSTRKGTVKIAGQTFSIKQKG
jgi:hypothetical protein